MTTPVVSEIDIWVGLDVGNQLLPGDAKTDARDAFVIATTALRMPDTLRSVDRDSEVLANLKVLSGFDEDLAHETTRAINRLRSLLLQIRPALEQIVPTIASTIKTLKTQRRELAVKVEALLEDFPPRQVLVSMPGVGTKTAAAFCDPESHAYYERKRAQGKRHNAAIICLARRRCDVLYAMLKHGTLYQPKHSETLALAA